MKNKILIFSDGGARGNPGPAAYGFLIYQKNNDDQKQLLKKHAGRIGVTTNNVAEYLGLFSALEWLVENYQQNTDTTTFCLDSALVVNQLKGLYKIKNKKLQMLVFKIKPLLARLAKQLKTKIYFKYIPRKKNYLADKLVNQALDGQPIY